MLRQVAKAAAATTLLAGVTTLTPVGSYLRCGWSHVSSSASDAVPVEWEIKRARQMIADLKPEIETNARRIAREKIEVARLEEQIADSDSRLAKARNEIDRLTDDLAQEHRSYRYGGKTYTSAQVKTDLSHRFDRFKTRQATLDKLTQMLSARQASLHAATDRMDAMMDAKRQLEVEVENLQARLGALRLAQTSSDLSLDDSMLSKTRGLLDEIATRLDVEEETMNVDVEYFGEIQLDEPNDENLLDEISAYFDAQAGTDVDAEVLVSID
ncbi:MAG: hypothetical protein AAGD07_08330 [Planctomycetota bacterium]